MTDPLVRLVMPAKSEYLILARLALAGIAREASLAASAVADLKLAVTEACGNAVRHAYRDDPGTVEVRFALDEDAITIEVRDEGGHGGEAVVAPAAPTDGLPAEGGMGLAIIEAVVDELQVEGPSEAKPGTVVRMRKLLSRDAPAPLPTR